VAHLPPHILSLSSQSGRVLQLYETERIVSYSFVWISVADVSRATAAWALGNPAVDGAIIGLRRPDQVASILHGAGLELSDADVAEIENGNRLEDGTR
jgi:aryl-alcohol dehydrogenase-like predicted oxidoreductase